MPARDGWHKSQRYMEETRETEGRSDRRDLAISRRDQRDAALGHNILCPYLGVLCPYLADLEFGQYT